jgi:hypothetical protein
VLKFADTNGNGRQDPGEPALPGWTFEITDASGATVATIKTGDLKQSCVDVRAPGTYIVTEQPVLSGWTPTTPNPQTVTVSPGQTVNLRFGNKKKKPDGNCDLEIKKTISPNPLVIGQPATITIKVANVGNAPCQGVTTMTDDQLAWLTVTSVAQGGSLWNCSTTPPNPGATEKCKWDASIQPVPPGPLPTITITGTVTTKPGSKVTNCATVTNVNDTNPKNDMDCVRDVPVEPPTTKLPDLTIKKRVSCPGPATAKGNKCTIAFVINNNGSGAFNGFLTVQDVLTPTPSSLSWAPPSGSTPAGWSCGIGLPSNDVGCGTTGPVTLAPLTSTTFSVDVYIPTGQYKNCASVKGYTQRPYSSSTLVQEVNSNNNEDCVGFVSGRPPVGFVGPFNQGSSKGSLFDPGPCDLATNYAVSPNPVKSGQKVTMTVTVKNVGGAECKPNLNSITSNEIGLGIITPGIANIMASTLPPSTPGGPNWGCLTIGGYCHTPDSVPPGYSATFIHVGDVTASPGSFQSCWWLINSNDTNPANDKSCVTISVN